MRKLIIILILSLLYACDIPTDVHNNEGTIIKVHSDKDGSYIKVKFEHNNYVSERWFIGSDTCKVGQKVRLQ